MKYLVELFGKDGERSYFSGSRNAYKHLVEDDHADVVKVYRVTYDRMLDMEPVKLVSMAVRSKEYGIIFRGAVK